jgi:hypothetical protein
LLAAKFYVTKAAMKKIGHRLLWLLLFAPVLVFAQIDPVARDLIQFGYDQAVEGRGPFSGYAFYYHNQPDFLRTNLTLRLAVAPVYFDSELGFSGGLGPHTDFAIGLAGGGFGDSYNEIRGGKFLSRESFTGNGGEISFSVYHLFNPADRVPLNLILRGTVHHSIFDRDGDTSSAFELPHERTEFNLRTGLRWGGIEPTLFPALAMELSLWYEGQFRTDAGTYGFNDDRKVEPQSHLFWMEAALCYTLPKSQQNFSMRLTAGTSVDADRFSAYRLGGYLPLMSEFPLLLPGCFFQEISARQFVLLNASYLLPLDSEQRWNFTATASTACVDYIPGLEQSGNSLSGLGVGIMYRLPSDRLKIMATYAYGFDAIRSHARGAQSVGILLQWDLGKTRGSTFNPVRPWQWRGWQRIFGN